MQTKIRGTRTGGSNEEVDIKASRDGDLRVAQYLPPYAMLVAAGKVFAYDMTAGTGQAPVTAMPTTSPEWMLYNANAGGGAHLVLLQVGVASVSGTMGLGLAVVCTTGIGAQTAQTAKYSGSIVSCLDGTSKTPNAFLANNVSIVGTQPSWVVFAAKDQAAVVGVGTGAVARVDGLIIAPPKGAIYVELISPTGTSPVFDITLIFAQVQLDAA